MTLTMPGTAGAVTVTATVAGLPPVQFTATAVNMPSAISILSGNNQTGFIGSALPQSLTVMVLGTRQESDRGRDGGLRGFERQREVEPSERAMTGVGRFGKHRR